VGDGQGIHIPTHNDYYYEQYLFIKLLFLKAVLASQIWAIRKHLRAPNPIPPKSKPG
jgi:hypothetical protein